MGNFLKENSYYIFKMIVNQIGMTMFGLMLSMATNKNDTVFLLASIFSAIFYLVLLYTMTWDIGYGEKTRIENKRLKFDRMKGLWMSLAANTVNLLLGAMAVIGYYCAGAYTVLESGAKAPVSPDWAVNLYGIGKTVATLLQGMYSGIISLYFKSSPWIFIVIVIPSLAVCYAAYIMGVKGKHFTKFLGPTESKE